MTFLAALLAWLVSLSLTGDRFPDAEKLQTWVSRLVQRFGGNRWIFLVVLFVPVLLAAAVLWSLDIWLIYLLVGFAALVLAFGPGDQADRLKQYREYQENDQPDEAYRVAVDYLGLPEGLYEGGAREMDEALKYSLAYMSFQRFFVTVFWFAAFGVPGVILASLLPLLLPVFRGEPAGPLSVQLHHAINWIPVRLLTISLALVGNFAQSFAIWWRRLREFEITDQSFLVSSVDAALPDKPSAQQPEDVLVLFKRAQILWLVALALFTIFAW